MNASERAPASLEAIAQHLQFGNLQAAEAGCHALLTEQPRLTCAWLLLAKICRGSRRAGYAVVCLEQALRIQPANIEVRRELADLYLQLGDRNRALVQLEWCAALLPSDAELRLQLAHHAARPGKPDH